MLRRREHGCYVMPGLLVRLLVVSTAGGGLVGRALAGDASGPALPVGGGDGEVDVLLGVHADHELGYVHELLAHPVFRTTSNGKIKRREKHEQQRREQALQK